MLTLSSTKYYRYKIKLAEDLSEKTIERRLVKAKQNFASHILVDWTEADNLNLSSALIEAHRHKIQNNFQKQVEHLVTLKQALQFGLTFTHPLHIQVRSAADILTLDQSLDSSQFKNQVHIHFSPRTTYDLSSLAKVNSELRFKSYGPYVFDFRVYNPFLKNSLTIQNIGQFFKSHPSFFRSDLLRTGALKGLEIWNDAIPEHYELESLAEPQWELSTPHRQIELSVIIPTFNNTKFLSNVLSHLFDQTVSRDTYEVIVVDDGGSDKAFETLSLLFRKFTGKVNLKYIYWSKDSPERGEQNFFRAGLARNLGVRNSSSENILFLDSDMLVPENFIAESLAELNTNDLIQFQRYHIHQTLSLKNPNFNQVNVKTDTYIEEKEYWSKLFYCHDWNDLNHHWKYTCTYALGIKKSDFIKCGRFKKYYISYGFEDTDLGFEMYKRQKKFKLVKLPLLHLTAYDKMQYQNSQTKRYRLLRKTASLFYLQHLDQEIFETLGGFFHFEKPALNYLRDLF